MDQQASPPPSKSGKGSSVQKRPPPPPSKKKVRPPTRKPKVESKLPPIKKKGRGKIWAGIIAIILGIVLVISLQGMSFLPFIGVIIILLGVYLLYKGVTAVDKVLTPVKVTRGGVTKTRKVYKDKKTLNKGVIFLLIVFIFFALPIFLTIFQFGNVTNQPYSIYNTGDGGCSILREDIESAGYQTTAIISGYEELRKFPEDYPLNRTVLFVLGPKAIFFPTGLFVLQELLDAGGRIVILQDMGTANEGLMFLGLFSLIGMAFGGGAYANPFDLPFQDGYVCQGAGGDETAAAFSTTLTIAGGSYNVLFWTASWIGGTMTGFTTVDSSPGSTWLDLNKNFQIDPEDITGSYALTAYSGSGNLIIITDPDIFTNKIMQDPGYQNRAFGAALVQTVTGGDTTWNIIFDEAHQVKTGYSAAFYFGTIIAIEDFVMLSWIFAPLGPYMAFTITKKFIPEAEKPEKAKLSKIRREGESLYAKRLDWFKKRRRYEKALTLLYRRLKRSLTKTLDIKGFNVDEVIDRILSNYPEGEVDEKQLVKAFKTFEEVERGRRVMYEYEFLKIFMGMQWVSDVASPR